MLSTNDYKRFKILDPNTGQLTHEFEGAEIAGRALPEDKVFMSAAGHIVILERAPKKNLVGVLRLTGKYMYGMTGHGVPIYLCEPYNRGYPPFRISCREKDRSADLIVVFQFDTWELGNELPRGALAEILGTVDNEAAQQKAIEITACPWTAPEPSSTSDQPRPTQRDTILLEGTFNIDPPGCRDIDDVLTLQQTGPTQWKFWITIADVAETIHSETDVYKVAQKITATTYTADGSVVRPMLHKSLSESQCSLLPGKIRNGLALCMIWDTHTLSTPFFEKVTVVNQESYTYETIHSSKTVNLAVLQEICAALTGDNPTHDSHKWIEATMIAYNKAAARALKEAGYGILRIHDAPFAEKLAQIKSLGKSELEYLAYESAKYVSVAACDTTHHFGLNTDLYCHATSPLRRFADLYNQLLLKKTVQSIPPTAQMETRLCLHLNGRQHEIAQAERDMAFRKAISKHTSCKVDALVLWEEQGKYSFWIPAWKTMIRKKYEPRLTPGKTVTITYYADMRKVQWKERMVIEIIE